MMSNPLRAFMKHQNWDSRRLLLEAQIIDKERQISELQGQIALDKGSLKIISRVSPELESAIKIATSLPKETIQAFLDRIGGPSELVTINNDGSFASGTGEVGIVFQPSNAFRDFLATFA